MRTIALPEVSASLPALQVRPASLHDINAILVLHQQAFADKFGSAFGQGEGGLMRGAAALEAAWRYQNGRALRGMLVAEWQHRIIGTTTLRTWELGDDDSEAIETAFQQVLGVWGALRSMFVLSLLNHRIARTEGFITDVAVDEAFQRRGVATALLVEAETVARRRRKHHLGLYVSSTNQGAITLYKQFGFNIQHTRHSLLTRIFFGHRTWYYMRKTLM